LVASLYWLQTGGCGGDTMSLLCAQSPDMPGLLESLAIDVLWHPSLATLSPRRHDALVADLLAGTRPLDLLVVEGSVLRGPGGTGLFDSRGGKPKKDLVAALAARAGHVIALGTCAAFGGIGVGSETDATGLQYTGKDKGGLLGESFRGRSGLPVINLAGCPCHPDIFTGTLSILAAGARLPLDPLNRPHVWYGMLVHQGCTRNEYHEYRVEEHDFGENGCLFFHMGCHGPLANGPCNKILWNGRSSKPRVGVPCFGCTDPAFPQSHPFFQTRNIEGIPLALPDGVKRAHYMVYKGMAAVAAPARLKNRQAEV
jgi:hydrogenase small subunit